MRSAMELTVNKQKVLYMNNSYTDPVYNSFVYILDYMKCSEKKNLCVVEAFDENTSSWY